jgi:hypothetical protein
MQIIANVYRNIVWSVPNNMEVIKHLYESSKLTFRLLIDINFAR